MCGRIIRNGGALFCAKGLNNPFKSLNCNKRIIVTYNIDNQRILPFYLLTFGIIINVNV